MNEWSQSLRNEFADKEYAHDYADELLYAYIATQIKILRQQQELTQEQLAQLSNMKQERISVLEDVNYSSWTINTLLKLARAFDLRLRVSFENFTTVLDDMFNLNSRTLQRTKREEDLGFSPGIVNRRVQIPFSATQKRIEILAPHGNEAAQEISILDAINGSNPLPFTQGQQKGKLFEVTAGNRP